jgi:hypothetical protein
MIVLKFNRAVEVLGIMYKRMIKCKDLGVGQVCNIPAYGPMQVKEKKSGTIRMTTTEGINFWIDEDKLVYSLSKEEVFQWASEHERNGCHNSCLNLKRWANAIF